MASKKQSKNSKTAKKSENLFWNTIFEIRKMSIIWSTFSIIHLDYEASS